MSLQEKYAALLKQADSSGIMGLTIMEEKGVLHVSGTASSDAVKDQLWSLYERLDPDMRSNDLVLDISVVAGGGNVQTYEVKAGDNLSKIAKLYPGLTWQRIYEANKEQIKNPDIIHPGQILKIPSA